MNTSTAQLSMLALFSGSDQLPQMGASLSDLSMVWAALFFLGLTLWMVIVIFFVKRQLTRSLNREQSLTEIWEPIFFGAVIGEEITELPVLSRNDQLPVLKIWSHICNNIAGEALDGLGLIARRLRLDQVALDILVHQGLRIRNPSSVELLLSIRAAERLLLTPAWDRLAKIVQQGPAPLDRYAARALVAIDPVTSATAVLPALTRQGRWARHLVEDLIEVGVAEATQTYADLLQTVDDEVIPGLALLLERCNDGQTLAAIRGRLTAPETQDPEAISALLNTLSIVGGASERELLQSFTGHRQWLVRMRAAQALGRCGNRHDAAILESLLSDENWYTRYHAARALLAIVELGRSHLNAFPKRTHDQYARDMALHVIAETEAPALR
ncbi:MAG: HEAT repeat domain-containing protein [Immundisolibacteraceae bacterium]|nr:HEAT repeat domain-containing protein [Immundisolibacteraceae bacterium]